VPPTKKLTGGQGSEAEKIMEGAIGSSGGREAPEKVARGGGILGIHDG